MIKLNNIELENFILASNPLFGYEPIYKEWEMISGKIRRAQKGQRFIAKLAIPYLNPTQYNILNSLLMAQKANSYLDAEISMPGGVYNGQVFLKINSDQARYRLDKNENWIWTNYILEIIGVDLV